MEKDKIRTVGWVPTRDGRLHFTLQFAATLTRGKTAFVGLFALGLVLFLLAPFFGWRQDRALQSRVQQLEDSLSRRLNWVATHQKHLQKHLLRRSWEEDSEGTGVARINDGRRHLWSDPNGYSRLAEALVAAGIPTTLPPVEDHYMCGGVDVTEAEVLHKKLAIAAVTWRAPQSLRNSMQSWRDGGLLDIIDERMLFINSPTQEDYDIAKEFEFDVYTTHERNGNIMAGPSIAYLAGNTSADYILFMEKDFVLTGDRDTVLKEMYSGVVSMARGIDVYRLRGKTDFPAEGMPDCCAAMEPKQCPYNSEWASAGYFSDHMNWLRVFCVDDPVKDGRGQVVHCTRAAHARGAEEQGKLAAGAAAAPGSDSEEDSIGILNNGAKLLAPTAVDSYCFSAGNSNWSNNPVLFPTAWFNEKLRKVAFEGEGSWERNNMFEVSAVLSAMHQPASRVRVDARASWCSSCLSMTSLDSQQSCTHMRHMYVHAPFSLPLSPLPHVQFNVMMNWLPWRPHGKVCVSYQGIFTHREIDQ